MYRIAVTNRHLCSIDYLSQIKKVAESGLFQAVLVREKDLTEREYTALARSVKKICTAHGIICIYHNYAAAIKGEKDPNLQLPLSVLEGMTEKERDRIRSRCNLFGTAVHSREQLEQALSFGVNYVVAGHIFETDCKKGVPPRGIPFLNSILSASNVPVYGIGGINETNEAQVMKAGAAGVCLMSQAMTLL